MLTPVRLLTSFTVHTDRISFRGMVSINHYAASVSIPFLKISLYSGSVPRSLLAPYHCTPIPYCKVYYINVTNFYFSEFCYIEKSLIFSGKKEVPAGQTDFSDFLNHTGHIQKKISSIIPLYSGQSQRIFNCENTGTNSNIGYRNCFDWFQKFLTVDVQSI